MIYPRYQDTTWVLTSDSNSNEVRNYADYLLNLQKGLDSGLIHELIHHTGIGDFYVSQREFGPINTSPINRFLPDHLGYMGGGELKSLSDWEASFLKYLIKNGTFSPQHDGGAVTNLVIPNKGSDYYLNFLSRSYQFNVNNRSDRDLSPYIDGFYTSVDQPTGKDKYDSLKGLNFKQLPDGKKPIFDNPDSLIKEITDHNKGRAPNLFVFKSNSKAGIWLPFDRHLLSLYHLTNGNPDTSQINVFINPNLPEINRPCAVGLDVLRREEEIPSQVRGNPVYGYSEVNNELRTVWWVSPIAQ